MSTELDANASLLLIKKILDMRDFKIIQKEEFKKIKDESGLILYARNKTSGRHIVVLYGFKDVMGIAWIRELHELMRVKRVTRGILYGGSRATPAAKKAAVPNRIEILHITPLTYRLFDHDYVPEHKIAEQKEIEDLIIKYKINRNALANIFNNIETNVNKSQLLDTIVKSVFTITIQPDGEFYPKPKNGGLLVKGENLFIQTKASADPPIVVDCNGFIVEGKLVSKSPPEKLDKVKLVLYTGDLKDETKGSLALAKDALKKLGVNVLIATKEIPLAAKKVLTTVTIVMGAIKPNFIQRLIIETGAEPITTFTQLKKLNVGQSASASLRKLKKSHLLCLSGCNNHDQIQLRFKNKGDKIFTKGVLGPTEKGKLDDLQIFRSGKLISLIDTIPDISTSEMELITSKITELGIDIILSSSTIPYSLQSQLAKAGSILVTKIPKETMEKINELSNATPILDLGMLDETMIGSTEILFERGQPPVSSIFINDENEMNLDSLEQAILEAIEHLRIKIESGVASLLTFIQWDDPVVLLLGGQVGDIIKIHRKSATAKVSVSYRIVDTD